jgi:hypothetical protein
MSAPDSTPRVHYHCRRTRLLCRHDPPFSKSPKRFTAPMLPVRSSAPAELPCTSVSFASSFRHFIRSGLHSAGGNCYFLQMPPFFSKSPKRFTAPCYLTILLHQPSCLAPPSLLPPHFAISSDQVCIVQEGTADYDSNRRLQRIITMTGRKKPMTTTKQLRPNDYDRQERTDSRGASSALQQMFVSAMKRQRCSHQ